MPSIYAIVSTPETSSRISELRAEDLDGKCVVGLDYRNREVIAIRRQVRALVDEIANAMLRVLH